MVARTRVAEVGHALRRAVVVAQHHLLPEAHTVVVAEPCDHAPMDPISEGDDDRPILGRRDGLRKTARSARKASSCLQGGPVRTGGLPLDSPVMPTFMGSLQVFLPIKQIKLTPCLSPPLRREEGLTRDPWYGRHRSRRRVWGRRSRAAAAPLPTPSGRRA